MQDDFYSKFEDTFRGTRDLIKSRLKVYLPFLEPLAKIRKTPLLLDLGCGRGEWLELSQEQGFQAVGVDLDQGMLQACQVRQLNAVYGDALEYLQSLPSESYDIVSAFHLVEHVPFDKLNLMIEHALRVLRPGGILILETPNPENIAVGTVEFYMDPTHVKPLPSKLLEHLVKWIGFPRVKIVYLQEPPGLFNKTIQLTDVFQSVSPDYGVIAQKSAMHDVMELFDGPFMQTYGVTLKDLSDRYDMQIENQINKISDWFEDNKSKYHIMMLDIQRLNGYLSRIEHEFSDAKKNLTKHDQEILHLKSCIETSHAVSRIEPSKISWSAIILFYRNKKNACIYFLKYEFIRNKKCIFNSTKTMMKYVIDIFIKNNYIRAWVGKYTKRYPRIQRYLYSYADRVQARKQTLGWPNKYSHKTINLTTKELSPRAAKIYDLIQAKNHLRE